MSQEVKKRSLLGNSCGSLNKLSKQCKNPIIQNMALIANTCLLFDEKIHISIEIQITSV